MNPLYSGHMTLQLVNHSKQDIRISPFIPIAQLFFIKLTSPPQNAYGEGGLQHKYMNDDGGPSFWWRDKRIKQLHAQLRKFDVSLQMEKELIDRIGGIRVSIIRRFWKYLEKTKIGQAESSDAVIERFLQKEKRSKAFNIARIALGVAFFPTMIGIALTMEFKDLGQTWFLVTTLISIIYFGHTCANYDLNFLTEEMLAENKQGQKE